MTTWLEVFMVWCTILGLVEDIRRCDLYHLHERLPDLLLRLRLEDLNITIFMILFWHRAFSHKRCTYDYSADVYRYAAFDYRRPAKG